MTDRFKARNGTGTILLVEDEEIVRNVVARLLQKCGYTVLAPETPIDAITISEDKGIAIDLILSDIVMPEMNGKEMVKKIKLLRPGIKILFMSGYTDEIISAQDFLDDGTRFITKPFDFPVLVSMIGEQLSPTGPGGEIP